MKKQLLAGAMAVALATAVTPSAMAFDHGGHGGGFGGFRSSYAAMPASRFAGVRGFNSFRHGGWGGRRFGGGGWGYGGLGYPYYDDGFDVGLGW